MRGMTSQAWGVATSLQVTVSARRPRVLRFHLQPCKPIANRPILPGMVKTLLPQLPARMHAKERTLISTQHLFHGHHLERPTPY